MDNKMFDLEKVITTAKEMGIEVKVNSSNPGFHFVSEDNTARSVTYDELSIGLYLLTELKRLKEDRSTLELFGPITLKKKSWFRFVKYNEKVHVYAFIENNKIEEFETFELIESRIMQWISELEI
ncbi:hypothetical protein [Bacillus sp. NPDC094106]|uniref:hypothetical protein n=1 Tax=Bacillus sp. NPDC094106 TaxID=3363949 RepID=UPI00381C3CCC